MPIHDSLKGMDKPCAEDIFCWYSILAQWIESPFYALIVELVYG
jgi:predicted solute-binding protein